MKGFYQIFNSIGYKGVHVLFYPSVDSGLKQERGQWIGQLAFKNLMRWRD